LSWITGTGTKEVSTTVTGMEDLTETGIEDFEVRVEKVLDTASAINFILANTDSYRKLPEMLI
jgi:hypothetical protein